MARVLRSRGRRTQDGSARALRLALALLPALVVSACSAGGEALPEDQRTFVERLLLAEEWAIAPRPTEVLDSADALIELSKEARNDSRAFVHHRVVLALARALEAQGAPARGGAAREESAAALARERIEDELVERLAGAEAPRYRAEIVQALGGSPSARARSILIAEARSELADVRRGAAHGLVRHAAHEDAFARWIELLRDPISEVRAAAILDVDAALEASQAFSSGGNDARETVARALEESWADEPPSTDENVRWAIVRAWSLDSEWRSAKAERLAKLFDDRNWLVARHAMRAFEELPPRAAAIDDLVDLARSDAIFAPRREAARRLLSRWGGYADLSVDDRRRIAQALAASAEARAAPPTIRFSERVEDDAVAAGGDARDEAGEMPESVGVERLVPLVVRGILEVEAKGEIAFHLFFFEEPRAVAHILRAARSGELGAVPVSRADPLDGFAIPVPPAPRDEPLVSFVSLTPRSLARGSIVLVPPTQEAGSSELWILGEPRPDLRGRAVLVGQVALGARLIEAIEPGDRVTLLVPRGETSWP